MDMSRLVADAILSATADAVVATDHDGVIRVWNPGPERIFGHRADEALGAVARSHHPGSPAPAPLGRLPPCYGNR